MTFKSFKSFGSNALSMNRSYNDIFAKGFNVISEEGQVLYYSYNIRTYNGSNVSNYGTGKPIQDAVLSGTTIIQDGAQYMPTTSANDGLIINRVVDTLNSSFLSVSFWFKTTELANQFYFISTLQTKNASSTVGNRWFIRIQQSNFLEIGTDNKIISTSSKPVLNQWYHIVVRMSDSDVGNL
jgi:hypothetical protein